MRNLERFVRDSVARLVPYSSARSECSEVPAREALLLDANESPWSGNRQAGGSWDNRYPEPQPKDLIAKLAQHYGVGVDNVLLTRGIDEGLDTVFRSFCEAGVDRVIIHPPTYGYYEVSARIQGCLIDRAPLKNDFSLDSEAILRLVGERTKLVILCNPNNPTGNLLDPKEIRKLAASLEGRSLLLIDEAYIEFMEAESFLGDLARFPHVLVMRTFSKAWGLAGVRLGVTIAHPYLISVLRKVLAPYPINRPSVQILEQALKASETKSMRERVLCLNALREGLARELKKIRGVTSVYPSATNFILLKVDDPGLWVERLWTFGIRIRNRSGDIAGCIRISVGSEEENARLLDALRTIKA